MKVGEFELDFSFLDPDAEYTAKIYSDTEDTHWKNNPMEYKISSKTINTKSKFNIYLAGGGFAIEILKNKLNIFYMIQHQISLINCHVCSINNYRIRNFF